MSDLINKTGSSLNQYSEMFGNYKANKNNNNKNSLIAKESENKSTGRAADVFRMSTDDECQTCKNRRYQDESNDSSVSYQNPTKISSAAAASAVKAHEMEHVRNNQVKARQEGKEIVSQYVRIKTGICPECGDTYVAGGETVTVTRTVSENDKPIIPEEEKPVLSEDEQIALPSSKTSDNADNAAVQLNGSAENSAVGKTDNAAEDVLLSDNDDENAEKFEVGKTEVVIGEMLDEVV